MLIINNFAAQTKRNFMRKSWFIYFFTIVFVQNFCKTVFSQDFEVAPVVLNYALEPGEIQTKSVSITNYSAKEYSYVAELFDEGFEDEQILRYQPVGTNPNSVADWLTVYPTFFKLKPNETRVIDVTLTVPSGNYETRWGALAIRTAEERSALNADKTLGAGILVSPRIKVTITQSPKSNTKFKCEVSNFRHVATDENGLEQFEVKVKNTGGKFVTPNIYLLVANMSNGKEIKEESFEFNLMPAQARTLSLVISKPLDKGEYAIAAVLDYGGNSPLEVVHISFTK